MTLDFALYLANQGLRVMPCHHIVKRAGVVECSCDAGQRRFAAKQMRKAKVCEAPGKRPHLSGWQDKASSDESVVREMWKNYPGANIGVVCGPESGIFVVDVDGEEGRESLTRLEEEHGPLPRSWRVKTGSGGLHIYFEYPEGHELKNSQGLLGTKIDTRGINGYVIGPGSVHLSGNRYDWQDGSSPEDSTLALTPQWMIDVHVHRKPEIKLQEKRKRLSERTTCAPSTRQQSGSKPNGWRGHIGSIGDDRDGFHAPIYAAMCSYLGGAGADADATELTLALREAISTARRDPAKARDRSQQLAKARSYIAASPPRAETAKSSPQPFVFDTEDEAVEELNSRAAICQAGDKVKVLIEKKDGGISLLSDHDAKMLFEPYQLRPQKEKERPQKAYELWRSSPNRRFYHGIGFFPSGEVPSGYYNLWKGFRVKPERGDWRRLQRHLLSVWCRDDMRLFTYFAQWLAQMFQDPENKIGVATVLQGRKGVGKSIVTNAFKAVLGPHMTVVSQGEQFVGKFNAHLATALIAVSEESFWAGDPRHNGPLKHMITGSTVQLEKKGVDAIELENHTRFILISNETRVVPATEDERRYFVLCANSQYKCDAAYFADLAAEMNDKGPAAMLYNLLRLDFDASELRNPPKTRWLVEQVAENLTAEERWWHSVLEAGAFFDADGEEIAAESLANWETQSVEIPRQAVFESFNAFVSPKGGRLTGTPRIGKFIGEMGVDLEGPRRRAKHSRPRTYALPVLAELRAKFMGRTGVTFKVLEEADASHLCWDSSLASDPLWQAGYDMRRDADLDLFFDFEGCERLEERDSLVGA